MNPYYHNHIIFQESFYFYMYRYDVPAPRFMYNYVSRTQYMEYVDDMAILNTSNTRSPWVNQQPMHHSLYLRNQYMSYPTPEDTSFDPSFVLEESLVMDELESSLAQQQVIDGTSGSGLSEEKISEHLHVYEITEGEEGDSCCICLGEYGKREKMGILECGHRYHAECIKRWLLSKNVCPMCRSTALTV
ncbi:hypothetical protein SSX86_019178 [Deinandra increscens subsp. villosa]|uniref:RING-type E3 ubiquitin transferase n=1 Tax=Deinandra increscens subsp. villosa TaxID=3103831 RepID=A0AAP0GVE6_9ASTR